jgi:RHS repeat-associated protein
MRPFAWAGPSALIGLVVAAVLALAPTAEAHAGSRAIAAGAAARDALFVRDPGRVSDGGCSSDGRYYDPATGQFLNVDPAVDQTEAPYAYVDGDPVDNADPTGLWCIGPICTHHFDPNASLDAIVNIGRGASFGLSDTIANWIVPGASCTVPHNRLDELIGGAAATIAGVGLAASRAAQEGAGLAFRSNTSHIFRDAAGHLAEDTPENRALLQNAVKPENFVGTRGPGGSISVYRQLLADGRQVWVEVRNGTTITNGGVNEVPR